MVIKTLTPNRKRINLKLYKKMSATKEYYLRLKEQEYEELSTDEKLYLNRLGMQIKQIPTDIDLNDERYKAIKKASRDAYNAEQEYLFEKRGGVTK